MGCRGMMQMRRGLAVAVAGAILVIGAAKYAAAQEMSSMSMGKAEGKKGVQVDPAKMFDKSLSNFEKEMVGLAEAMPEDKYNFAPTAGEFKDVRTFGQQVAHVAAANYYFFKDGGGAKTSVDADAIEKLTGKAEILKALKDSFAYGHAAIATMTTANMLTEVGKPGGGFTRAAAAAGAVAHGFDHYGQLVVYLRMNGIVPPASRK